jgi:peptide/nickel transport system permease protein
MAAIEPIDLSARAALPRRSRFSGLLSVSFPDRLALAALGLVTFIAVLAPVLAPHDPRRQIGTPYASPSSAFPLGTDEAGRDMLSRVLLGVQTTWLTALLIIVIGVLIGGAVGLIAGAAGGWVDSGLMRITDLFLAMPAAVLAISVVAAMGPSLTHIVIAVSILWWPYYARLIRVQVRDLAARPHLEAARLAGCKRRRLVLRHLLPGAVPVAIVAASLDMGGAIGLLAGLSFLGLGTPPPSPELGAMTATGSTQMLTAWWLAAFPALAVFLLCLVANVAGDTLRDLVDR